MSLFKVYTVSRLGHQTCWTFTKPEDQREFIKTCSRNGYTYCDLEDGEIYMYKDRAYNVVSMSDRQSMSTLGFT